MDRIARSTSRAALGSALRLLVGALLAGWAILAVGSCASAAAVPTGDRAIFAGGCYWCVEEAFETTPGVLSATSGMAETGSDSVESVEVAYDAAKIPYERLLDVFWRNVDPLDAGGQFCDRGARYRAAIFIRTDEERRLAEASKRRVAETLRAPVATEILPARGFHPVEPSEQDFYKKNPKRYHEYKHGCGRERRLRELWGDRKP